MKPLRIVHCAHFSDSKLGAVYYAMDRKLSNGLIRNGHFVHDFSYREIAKNATFFKSKKWGFKKTNAALLETLKNIEPELLLLGHSELISIETLQEAKKRYPKMKIAMWWVDWIYNLNSIDEKITLLDHFFITSDPALLNVTHLTASARAKCSYLPNLCDTSIDTYQAFERSSYDYDVIFIGRADKEREPFIHFLKNNFSHLKLGLFGLTKESIITGTAYLKTIGASKIGINYSRDNTMSMYSSDRIIHLMANGTLVFSPKIPNLDSIITHQDIVYFDNNEECKEKINYYLDHEAERKHLAAQGYHKAHTLFNEKRVTKFMLESVYNMTYSEAYEWIK